MYRIFSVISAKHSPYRHFIPFVLCPLLSQCGTLRSSNNLHPFYRVLTDDLQANYDIRHHKFAELFEMRASCLLLEHHSYHLLIKSQHLGPIYLKPVCNNNIKNLAYVLVCIRLYQGETPLLPRK